MTTAFVLSGGASLGAVQVGMLHALDDAGIRPDLVVGTSVGAINAAWIAAHSNDWRLAELETLWLSLRRAQIFPTGPTGLFGLLGRRAGLVDSRPLRGLLTRHLACERIEDSAIRLHVIATDVLTGRDVRFSTGSTVDAVLASASIPGVFSPVEIGGRAYMDGGVVNNAAISHAVGEGATTVFVLPTGFSCSLEHPPTGALGMALHGLAVLVQHRLADDIEHFQQSVDIRVVPPPCPIRVGPADFSHARELIDEGHRTASEWLHHAQPNGVRLLRAHDHPVPEGAPPGRKPVRRGRAEPIHEGGRKLGR